MFQTWLSKLANISRGLLAPDQARCLICTDQSASSSGGLPLCQKCYTHISWIKPQDIRCDICGRYERCPDCPRRKATWFELNRSIVRYDDVMKDWLGRFKYRGDERLKLLFAGMFESLFYRFLADQSWSPRDVALLTYVPLSSQRLEERGFNQAELFVRAIGSKFRIPVIPLLDRAIHTSKQSYKTRSERIHDLEGVFVPNKEGMRRLAEAHNPRIVIADDVYTTGSTMNECAKIIREYAPHSRIFSLTWAR